MLGLPSIVERWFEEIVVWGARHHPSQNRGGRLTAGGLFKAMVAESKVLDGEVGSPGEKSADDGPYHPEK